MNIGFHEVGEIFEHEGVRLEVVEGQQCDGCHFDGALPQSP